VPVTYLSRARGRAKPRISQRHLLVAQNRTKAAATREYWAGGLREVWAREVAWERGQGSELPQACAAAGLTDSAAGAGLTVVAARAGLAGPTARAGSGRAGGVPPNSGQNSL